MPVGIEYNGKAYYFNKNAQGDVLEIVDANGKVISGYIYDAWGNVGDITGDAELAKINPFRYRGYYQDNETGFYYLQSRYYDSTVGRFLNADIQLTDNSDILGTNLYTYCYNNPIGLVDYNGMEPLSFSLVMFAACVVMIFAISVVILPAFLRAWRNVCDDIINAMERSFDMMYGVARSRAIMLASRAKDVYFQVCNSLARAKTLNYSHSTEVHHVVAQRATNAKYARDVLYNVGIGYNSNYNLIRIKTGLHRRLHTDLYYGWANSVVISAYNSAGNQKLKQRSNVIAALNTLKSYIRAMDALTIY